jgi:hypothetical protein
MGLKGEFRQWETCCGSEIDRRLLIRRSHTSNSAAPSMQNVLELESHFELPILQCIIL